jgi:hypothetical protein
MKSTLKAGEKVLTPRMIAQAKLINANHSENSTKALENYKKWKK